MSSRSVSDLQRNEDKIMQTRPKCLSDLIKGIPFVTSF